MTSREPTANPTEGASLNQLFDPPPSVVAQAVQSGLDNDTTSLDLPTAPPRTGMAAEDALGLVIPYLRGGGRQLADPGFLAHMDPPTPWVSWVAALVAASANQNLLHPDTAPAARAMEETVIGWLSAAFDMDGGHLVPGSTIANLTALWAARDITGANSVVASTDSHLSVRKAAAILGMDYRAVDPSGPGRAMTAADRAEVMNSADGPTPERTVLVLTAGTTGTGAVDQMDRFGDAADGEDPTGDHPRPAWVHVDAAWAGPLRISATHRHRLAGLDRADSVAISAHKWFHQPKESAVVLFADVERANRAISVDGAYLAVPNVGVLGSHGATAAPLAATMLHLGLDGMAGLVERGMTIADRLLARIDDEERLMGFGPNSSGVVAWRHLDHDSRSIRAAMLDLPPEVGAFVSTVEIDGVTWLRSVAANPLADPDRVVDGVLRAARALTTDTR